jgi:hypothetical protein
LLFDDGEKKKRERENEGKKQIKRIRKETD